MAQGGIGYAAKGFMDGFLKGYQAFPDSDDRAYKKLKTKFLQSQIDKNSRGPVAKPVRDYTAINNRANAQAEYYNAKRKMLLNPAPTPPGDQEGIENSIPAPRSAIPPAPGGDQVSELQPPAEQGPPETSPEAVEQAPTVQSAAKGGMISAIPKRYAEGGDVDDDEEEEPEEEDDGEEEDELPANSAPTQGGAPQDYSIMAAHDAARDGIVHSVAQNNVGGHGLAVPAQPAVQAQNNRAHLTGAGAASHLDMERIRNKVDPDHKLEEGERNMAALSAVQSYYLKQNNPKAAQETAASMVGYFRKEFDRNKAMAGAAAEHGDIDTAIDYSKKAYANLPDGMKYDAKKNEDGSYTYNLLDGRTGKPLFKPQTVTPEVMLKQIQDSANSSFDGLMAAASGHRAGLTKPPPEPKVMKPSDQKTSEELIDNAWKDHLEELTPAGGKTPEFSPSEKMTLKDSAFHLLNSPQNKLTSSEAVGVALKMSSLNPEYKFKAVDTKGGKQVTFKNGQSLFVPEAQFDNLVTLRGTRTEEAKKKTTSDAEPNIGSRAASGVASVFSGAVGNIRKSYQSMKEQDARDAAAEAAIPPRATQTERAPTPAWFRGAIPNRQNFPPVQGTE